MSAKTNNRVRCRVCGKETAAGSLVERASRYSPSHIAWDMRYVRRHKNAAKEWCGGWVLCGRWVPPKGSGTWHVRVKIREPKGLPAWGGSRENYWDVVRQIREESPWKERFTTYTETRRMERGIKPELKEPIKAFID